ncbi:MAG: hypothetical protein ACFE8B_11960, partial [Candidatus Hermodarchaeota archaeon]
SLKLGMRPRNRGKKEEMLFEYMGVVNDIFERNLQIQIYNQNLVKSIKEIELLFLRNRGDLPYKYIKNLINVYYELRKIDVPNLYKGMTGEDYFETSNLYMLNVNPRRISQKKEGTSKFKPILLQKIKEQERVLQNSLQRKLDQTNIERAIFLKNIKESLTSNHQNRITLQGTLKDNLNYNKSQNTLIKYFILGIAFLSLSLGVLIGVEIFLFPDLMKAINHLLLIFFGIVITAIFLYKHLHKRGEN